jgi:hypothetical protein
MPKFKIEATRKMCMFVIVEADNLEEAERLYDQDLMAEDYEEDEGGSWTLDDITEL